MLTNLIDQSRSPKRQPPEKTAAVEPPRRSAEKSLLSSVTESNETRFITGFVVGMAIVCVSILLLLYVSILFAPE